MVFQGAHLLPLAQVSQTALEEGVNEVEFEGGAPCTGLVPFDQEGDGGGGASKQRYCLVMSGPLSCLHHWSGATAKHQRIREGQYAQNGHMKAPCTELMSCLMGSLITICSISFSWVFKERSSPGVSWVKYVPVQDWSRSRDSQRRALSCIQRESDFHFIYI